MNTRTSHERIAEIQQHNLHGALRLRVSDPRHHCPSLRSFSAKLALAVFGSWSLIACAEGPYGNDSNADMATESSSETGTQANTETGSGTDIDDDLCTQGCTVAADCGGKVSLAECVTECQQLFAGLEEFPSCIPPPQRSTLRVHRRARLRWLHGLPRGGLGGALRRRR